MNVAKNSMSRKHGFAPYQHVFGSDLRVPGLISEAADQVPFNTGVVHASDWFQRSHEMRAAARRAMVNIDEDLKVRRAIDHRTRPSRGPYEVGQLVYYWRRPPGENKKGIWKGPARVIGFYDAARIWVSHGNKVIRCSPEHLRALTTDQEAALKFVTPDILAARSRFADRGAQTFTDITREEKPDIEMNVDEVEEPATKRQRVEQEEEASPEVDHAVVPASPPQSVDEEPTKTPDESQDDSLTESGNLFGNRLMDVQADTGNALNTNYGPARADRSQHEHVVPDNQLNEALRRSHELLDTGNVRAIRGPFGRHEIQEEFEVFVCSTTEDDATHYESFMASHKKNEEIREKDLTEDELRSLEKGMRKEWDKLINADAIKIFTGPEATTLRAEIANDRIVESRYVKTRRECPDDPEKTEIKVRWVLKGYMDPDLEHLERQSPTLSADGLATALQLAASNRWVVRIADVEGAFLQGDRLERKSGRIFANPPREGIPGVPPHSLIEMTKCVYGLMDAPRQWWKCFTQFLCSLGMKQSPCIFYWYCSGHLHGVVALHVDDMLIAGTLEFETVLTQLRGRYPFKHWKERQGDFLGRKIKQYDDFSIEVDQSSYAKEVKTAIISKERRRQKDDDLTKEELSQYRAILGAANWIVGTTRPDIAADTALLQQRVSRATVGDLIEANKLVAKMRDFSHVRIHIKSIPLNEAIILATSDASWSNAESLGSQAGYMVLLAHQGLRDGKWATISPLRWKSYKLERRTQSTLGAELMSASRALAEANWIRSLFAEARNEKYDLTLDREFRSELPLTLAVDNKPVYDHVHGDGIVVKDKRLAIDMLILRADLRGENADLRWVDTRQMIVDVLTKMNANPEFLFHVLKYGTYILVEEGKALEWRSRERTLKKKNGSYT